MSLERKPLESCISKISKQFPRLSCLPKPPTPGEKGSAAYRTWPGYSWHPLTASSKSERVSWRHRLWHLTRAGVLKQFIIFMAPGPQPDVTPGAQSQLIGNEGRLIGSSTTSPCGSDVMEKVNTLFTCVSVPQLPWPKALQPHCLLCVAWTPKAGVGEGGGSPNAGIAYRSQEGGN